MKLLTSVFPRNGRVLPAGGWFTLAVVASLVGLEVVGHRYATTDVHDGLAAFALVGIGFAVALRHRREPLAWVNRLAALGRRVASSVAWLRYDHGVDLRGTPPLPRRTPPVVFLLALVLAGWGALVFGLWTAFPTGWRVISFYSSYTLYLLFMLALWSSLLTVTFVGLCVPVAMLDKRLKNWVGDADRRGAGLAVVVFYAVLVATVAYFVPPAPVLALCAAVAVVAWLLYLPRGADGAALLWRSAPDKPVYAVPLRRALAIIGGLTALFAFALLMTACGGRLFTSAPRADDAMPFTALLGTAAAWFMPGLLIVILVKLCAARRNDPARRTAPTLHVSGVDALAVRAAVRIAKRWGWTVRCVPAVREPGQVGIEVVEPARSEATEFDPRWPLKLSVADLEAGAVKERLDRHRSRRPPVAT